MENFDYLQFDTLICLNNIQILETFSHLVESSFVN